RGPPNLAMRAAPHFSIPMSLPIEHLAPRDSLIARWDARWRLAAIALAIGCVAALDSALICAIALALALLLAGCARVPRRWFYTRLGVLLFTLAPFWIILPL